MKVLLFGKTGQIGRQLALRLSPWAEVIAPDSYSMHPFGNFSDAKNIFQTVVETHPDVVINAAAWTDVDAAENALESIRAINVEAPAAIARASELIGAVFVHYSSDYVFNGIGSKPWSEQDLPAPLNAYGQSKFDADIAVLAACSRHLIFRISWLHGNPQRDFVARILKQAKIGTSLQVVDDQVGTPTSAGWVADATDHALRHCLSQKDLNLFGLYNLSASGYTSRYNYARFVLDEAVRTLGVELPSTYPSNAVKPVLSSDYPSVARRPLNSRLDITKFESVFKRECPAWQLGVRQRILEQL